MSQKEKQKKKTTTKTPVSSFVMTAEHDKPATPTCRQRKSPMPRVRGGLSALGGPGQGCVVCCLSIPELYSAEEMVQGSVCFWTPLCCLVVIRGPFNPVVLNQDGFSLQGDTFGCHNWMVATSIGGHKCH